MGIRVTVGTFGKVTVEGMYNRIFLLFFGTFSVPLTNAGTTSIGEYTSTQLLEDVYNSVALGSIVYLFRARVDTKRGFRGNSLF